MSDESMTNQQTTESGAPVPSGRHFQEDMRSGIKRLLIRGFQQSGAQSRAQEEVEQARGSVPAPATLPVLPSSSEPALAPEQGGVSEQGVAPEQGGVSEQGVAPEGAHAEERVPLVHETVHEPKATPPASEMAPAQESLAEESPASTAASSLPSSTPPIPPSLPSSPPVASPPPARAPLPEEFLRESLELADRAPGLRRTLARIWGDPNLDEIRRIRLMDREVEKARELPVPESSATKLARLAREGNTDELAKIAVQLADEEEAKQRSFALTTAIVADTLELDVNDSDYLTASTVPALQDVVLRKSPIIQRVREETESNVRSTLEAHYRTQIAQLEAAHRAALAAKDKEWQVKLDVAIEQTRAKERAGRPAPSPLGQGSVFPASTSNRLPADRAEAMRQIRGLFSRSFKENAQRRAEQEREAI